MDDRQVEARNTVIRCWIMRLKVAVALQIFHGVELQVTVFSGIVVYVTALII